MRVIVAGSRDIHDYDLVCRAIERSGFQVDVVLSGGAEGVDKLGERWAGEHGVPVERYPADWQKHGRAAGPIRNRQMGKKGDALVAVMRRPGTPGTRNMIQTAERLGLKVYVLLTNSETCTIEKG